MSHSRPRTPATEPTYDSSRPAAHIQLLYNHTIPNCPGKSLVALQVSYPPNGSTPPHTHAGAFLAGNVVSGYFLSKMNDEPMKVYGPGETFTENPGCKHKISDNASSNIPTVVIATLFVDTKVVDESGIEGLVVIDEQYRK